MGLSKTTRISIMLVIDIVFFLVELAAGLYSQSLALMADAFHMVREKCLHSFLVSTNKSLSSVKRHHHTFNRSMGCQHRKEGDDGPVHLRRESA
jgi:Co/Zn/Cd efflux system component